MTTRSVTSAGLSDKVLLRKILFTCGILSSLYYVGLNILVPIGFDGYSYASYTVSELSAIDSPTRQIWVLLAPVYTLLFAAFGWGVWQSAGENRNVRVVGALIVVYCAINTYWPPMHLRGNEPTLTDTLHIIWAMIAVLFMMTMMGFGAAAFDKRFRIYTIASMALHVIFGFLTTLEAPNIPRNLPTPFIGVWERINIGVFMLWVIVLAVGLWRKENRI